MFPTLPATDSTAIIKSVNRLGRGLAVGDVVVAKHPWFLSHGIGKRILGMPGDYVILDPSQASTANVDVGPTAGMMVQVPEGHCWLGGDNLPWSRDSRDYGPVPLALISGKLVGVFRWMFPLPVFYPVKNTLKPVEWEDDEETSELVVGLQEKEKSSIAEEANKRKG